MSTVNRGAGVPAPRPHVQAFADDIFNRWGLRSGTYNGHLPTPDRALDTFANRAQGDAIAQHAIDNKDHYGGQYCIWRQRINSYDGRGWRWMSDRGDDTQNHYDHTHNAFETHGAARPGTSPGGEPVTGTSCEEQIWAQGDSGDCVIGIQDHLNRHGAGIDADGDFGPVTRVALENFQRSHGLAPDGVCGLKTWPVLISGIPTVTPIVPPVPVPPQSSVPEFPGLIFMGQTGENVRRVQERLVAHGHKLNVDGDFGPQTRARVQIHQAAWRLEADGVVGPQTWPTLWVDLP